MNVIFLIPSTFMPCFQAVVRPFVGSAQHEIFDYASQNKYTAHV